MNNPYQNNLSINIADIDQQTSLFLDPATGGIIQRTADHSQPDFQTNINNMGIARFAKRHSPSLDNLFSNRDGKN